MSWGQWAALVVQMVKEFQVIHIIRLIGVIRVVWWQVSPGGQGVRVVKMISLAR